MHVMLARWIPPLERSTFSSYVYAGKLPSSCNRRLKINAGIFITIQLYHVTWNIFCHISKILNLPSLISMPYVKESNYMPSMVSIFNI